MNQIEELQAEIARLKEQLQPYLDAEEAERQRQAWQDRLEYLVDLCIPSYDRVNLLATNKEFPIRHPQTASWWNGASVEDFNVMANGDVRVEVKSYVGHNEYDDDEIILLKEWFDLENPTTAVQEWCVKETERLAEVRREYARQETARKIESLQKELARLENSK